MIWIVIPRQPALLTCFSFFLAPPQEYTMLNKAGNVHGWPLGGYPAPQGPFYCGVGSESVYGRQLAEAHMDACVKVRGCQRMSVVEQSLSYLTYISWRGWLAWACRRLVVLECLPKVWLKTGTSGLRTSLSGNESPPHHDTHSTPLSLSAGQAGLIISGINAEVMPGQWEFQIGPVGPLEVGDQVSWASTSALRQERQFLTPP